MDCQSISIAASVPSDLAYPVLRKGQRNPNIAQGANGGGFAAMLEPARSHTPFPHRHAPPSIDHEAPAPSPTPTNVSILLKELGILHGPALSN